MRSDSDMRVSVIATNSISQVILNSLHLLSDCPSLQDPAHVLVEDQCFYFLTRLILSRINRLVEAIFYQKRNVIPRITRRSLRVCFLKHLHAFTLKRIE